MRRYLLVWFLIGLPFWARAHDPYEITSTASVFTNSIDIRIEMEFRTAMRLAGAELTPAEAIENSFRDNRDALLRSAGEFFRVFAGGNLLPARETNVVLGVENHVQFELRYPASHFRPLRFVAEGLKPFEGQGPYGTTLTVLDMVGKTVIGQTVLSPATETGEFGATTSVGIVESNPIQITKERLAATNVAVSTQRTISLAPSNSVILIIGAMALLVGCFWGVTRKP